VSNILSNDVKQLDDIPTRGKTPEIFIIGMP
jgi:hypothetical protein